MKISTPQDAQQIFAPPVRPSFWRRPGFTCFLLVLAVFVVFWPVRNFEFVHYDDPDYITNNPHVRQGLTPSAVVWALGSGYVANWHPVTWWSHMFDVTLFGLEPGGPHLVNVLFHSANTLLLFLLLRRLTGAHWRSAFVAALFALHPLHVESVAWVSERKDMLSALFGFMTLWFYGRYAGDSQAGTTRPRFFYGMALLCFAIGLMSKPMLVTIPFVLLLLDYWPLCRISAFKVSTTDSAVKNPKCKTFGQLLLEKIPFFALGAISSIVTFLVQKQGGAIQAVTDFPVGVRIENAFVSYARYLAKTFWPFDLVAPYPHPGHWPVSFVVLAVVLVGVASIGALWFGRKWPFLLTGWFWFLGMLVPVIGLIQVGGQAMADRYSYLPLIGIFIIVSWGANAVLTQLRAPGAVLAAAGAVVLVACAARTSDQLSYWQNSEKLFRHAIQLTKDNAAAYNGLGCYYDHLKRPDEAVANYREAVRLDPKNFLAWDNLGFYFYSRGQLAEATDYYHRALAANPSDPVTLNNLGSVFLKQKKYDDAIRCYRAALLAREDFPDAHINLGMALNGLGQTDDAATHYLEALRLMPDSAEAHNNLANLLFGFGRLDDAISHYRAALKFNPNFEEAWNNLGWTLAAKSEFPDAIACYQHLLQMNPKHSLGHLNLGKILAVTGRNDEAVAQFAEAVRLDPGSADAHFTFSKALTRSGHPEEAAAQLKEALRLDPNLAESAR